MRTACKTRGRWRRCTSILEVGEASTRPGQPRPTTRPVPDNHVEDESGRRGTARSSQTVSDPPSPPDPPAPEEVADAAAVAVEAAGVPEGGLVFLVEDDEGIQEVVTTALELEGYDSEFAPDGAAALARLARNDLPRPDVILLDMRMPIMDGWQFAEAYRKLPGPHAPVIVFTAARDGAERAAQIRASDILSKPFEIDDLVQMLRRHIRRS